MGTRAYQEFVKKAGKGGNGTSILEKLAQNGTATAGTLAKSTGMSIPTVTKAMERMTRDGLVTDCGKQRAAGSRKSKTYALNPSAGYFAGVEIHRHHLKVGICDMTGEIVYESVDKPFLLENDDAYEKLCAAILESFDES